VTQPPAQPAAPPRFGRADVPEVAALKRLKTANPELGPAVDLQVDLVGLYRKVQSRLSTPWLELQQDVVSRKLQDGTPLLEADTVAFDWGELRSLVRQIADLLKRFDLLEPADYEALQTMVRAGKPHQPEVTAWFHRRTRPDPVALPDALSQIMSLANRPFLARAVGVIQQQVDLANWHRPYCPFCGSDPELGVLTADGGLRLLCACCTGTWPFDDVICPHCDSRDTTRRTSLESRDGRYRLVACDVCRRYLKWYVARGAERAVMFDVDTIATLPLDAVAAQRGYSA